MSIPRSRALFVAAAILIIGGGGVWYWRMFTPASSEMVTDGQPRLPTTTLTVNGYVFTVELARSPEEQRQGLSFRAPLQPDEGMLFVYDVPQEQQFWMFGMTFPLDMVFLRDQKVVYIAENVPPPTGIAPPAIVRSPADADMVLELSAGTAERIGMDIGTEIL